MQQVSIPIGASTLIIECGRLAKQAEGSAYVRYGDTGHANLHYCDWIRGWTDVCLRIYGEIAARNPKYLEHFEEERSAAA